MLNLQEICSSTSGVEAASLWPNTWTSGHSFHEVSKQKLLSWFRRLHRSQNLLKGSCFEGGNWFTTGPKSQPALQKKIPATFLSFSSFFSLSFFLPPSLTVFSTLQLRSQLFKWNKSFSDPPLKGWEENPFSCSLFFGPLMALFSGRFLILLVMMRWLLYYQAWGKIKGRKMRIWCLQISNCIFVLVALVLVEEGGYNALGFFFLGKLHFLIIHFYHIFAFFLFFSLLIFLQKQLNKNQTRWKKWLFLGKMKNKIKQNEIKKIIKFWGL